MYVAAGKILFTRTSTFSRQAGKYVSNTAMFRRFRRLPLIDPSFSMQHENYQFVIESIHWLSQAIPQSSPRKYEMTFLPRDLLVGREIYAIEANGKYVNLYQGEVVQYSVNFVLYQLFCELYMFSNKVPSVVSGVGQRGNSVNYS